MDIGGIYKGYLKSMALLGRMTKWPESWNRGDKSLSVEEDNVALVDFDAEATRAGNQYRALGTLVGFFGIAIVFLAIAPIGLKVDHEIDHMLGILKVGLMAVMLAIVLFGNSTKLKNRWINLRVKAEDARYIVLYKDCDKLSHGLNLAIHNKLCDGLVAVLEGKDGQIAYDEGKASQYQAIESFSEVLLWLAVGLAFVGAILHLYYLFTWLIFLTAFGPAAVGGIHGINAFLCVGELAKKHKRSAIELTKYLEQLRAIKNAKLHDTNELLAVASDVLSVLTERDINWKALVQEIGIKPT